MASRTFRIIPALGLLLALASPAAAVDVYTDQASFLAAISTGYYLETFDGVEASPEPPIPFSSLGFEYEANVPGGSFVNYANPSDASDIWLSTNVAFDSLQFSFTSGNVTAVGGFFFTAVLSGAPATVDLHVETDQNAEVLTPGGADPELTFLGFVSDVPFTSLALSSISPDGFPHWPVANDLIVGMAVPEPSSAALLLLGVTCMTLLGRDRGARSA